MRGDRPLDIEMDAKVVGKEPIADGVVRLVLRHSFGGEFPGWEPGAHIDLSIGSDEVVRQYSLCGDPADRSVFQVAVLREPESRGGSAFVHDKLEEGDRVRIRGPRNNFPLVAASRYLFIAGGIGITPILPMIERVANSGAEWRLVYGGRSRSSMAFRDQLTAAHPESVRVRPEDETGLLDLDAELGAPDEATAIYCCGPEGLLEAVERHCAAWPSGCLHVERFSPKPQGEQASESFEVELARTGSTVTVPAGQSIVEALEEAGVEVEVSCLEGTCGTCETAVLGGEPDHRDSILTDEERAQNDVMFVCVGRSRSARLRLDL
jgi:ferredoxin-NADP reductase